nr:hypothetical protein DO63_1699 [Burkholderia pseudomallei]
MAQVFDRFGWLPSAHSDLCGFPQVTRRRGLIRPRFEQRVLLGKIGAFDLSFEQDCETNKLIGWMEFEEALNVSSALPPVLRIGWPKPLTPSDSGNQRYRVSNDHRLQPRPNRFHISTPPRVVRIDDDQKRQQTNTVVLKIVPEFKETGACFVIAPHQPLTIGHLGSDTHIREVELAVPGKRFVIPGRDQTRVGSTLQTHFRIRRYIPLEQGGQGMQFWRFHVSGAVVRLRARTGICAVPPSPSARQKSWFIAENRGALENDCVT